MMRLYLSFLLLVLLFGCQWNGEPRESDDPLFFLLKRLDAVEKIKDQIYREARNKIVAAGWTPLQSNTENDERLSHGAAKEFWKNGYFEIEECGGDWPTFCYFIFKDSLGNKLFVTTVGNQFSGQAASATVTYTQVISEYKPSNDE